MFFIFYNYRTVEGPKSVSDGIIPDFLPMMGDDVNMRKGTDFGQE
jgi:hypothetical protein